MSTKHEFALYVSQLPSVIDHTVTILDTTVVHRVFKVLRLQPGAHIVLFDGQQALHVTITTLDKKQLVGTVHTTEVTSPLTPEITCYVPLLKRAALEEVIYAAVELGANVIQLVSTQKIHRKWGDAKELQRLKTIMTAACEQAKQFSVPKLHEPISFAKACKNLGSVAIFFDPEGQPAFDIISKLRAQNPTQLALLIGPEGDLSAEEKDLLRERAVTFCALTPTVLRAKQAFAVGLGMIRSVL